MSRASTSRRACKPDRGSARSSGRVGDQPVPARQPLSRAAARLLAALGQPDVSARPDPTREGVYILQVSRAGVSLGRGSHPQAIVDELARHDLIDLDCRARVTISGSGRAHLRRLGAEERDAAFGGQHRDLVQAEIQGEIGRERVTVNAAESPLEWLRRRRDRTGEPLIDAASFEAGERFRRDLTVAGLLPSVTARWDGAVGTAAGCARDPAGAADAVIAARQRVRAALGALPSEFADLLIDLCGFLKGLDLIERERGWPARSAKVVVRLALGQLARHYGLESEARGRPRSGGVRAWIAAGGEEAA